MYYCSVCVEVRISDDRHHMQDAITIINGNALCYEHTGDYLKKMKAEAEQMQRLLGITGV